MNKSKEQLKFEYKTGVKYITAWRFCDSSEVFPEFAFPTSKKISSPLDIANIFIPFFRDKTVEMFTVAHLSSANNIIAFEVISSGLLNSSLVHAREVFRGAIVNSCANIVLMHNHPSGNSDPSEEDITITKKCVEAGKILGITVFDHIIIGGSTFQSLVEKRLI